MELSTDNFILRTTWKRYLRNKGATGRTLSPLCGNVMLNELDKELERRGHKFVRYADDCAPRRRVQVA